MYGSLLLITLRLRCTSKAEGNNEALFAKVAREGQGSMIDRKHPDRHGSLKWCELGI
jgi:hypothetical protein